VGVGALQDLPGTEAVRHGAILFDSRHGAWFPAPSMVNEQFCIHSEKFVEQFLIVKALWFADGAPGNIS
jgi:hypothetical protein